MLWIGQGRGRPPAAPYFVRIGGDGSQQACPPAAHSKTRGQASPCQLSCRRSSVLSQQLGQPRDVRRDPPRFVWREDFGLGGLCLRCAGIDIRKRLAVGVSDDVGAWSLIGVRSWAARLGSAVQGISTVPIARCCLGARSGPSQHPRPMVPLSSHHLGKSSTGTHPLLQRWIRVRPSHPPQPPVIAGLRA